MISTLSPLPLRQKSTDPSVPTPNPVNIGDMERLLTYAGGLALLTFGLRKRSFLSLSLAALSGALFYRAHSGHCPLYHKLGLSTESLPLLGTPNAKPIHIDQSLSIQAPLPTLRSFFHNFENLPTFLRHVKDVRVHSRSHSRWTLRNLAGAHLELDILALDQPHPDSIAWRSTEGSDILAAGQIDLTPLPDSPHTLVRLIMDYQLPSPRTKLSLTKTFDLDPNQQVAEDLLFCKQLVETGQLELAPSLRYANPQRSYRRAIRKSRLGKNA